MKIFSYDIETSPNLAYVWGKYDQNVIEFASEWNLMSFAIKELGKKTKVFGTDEYTEEELVKLLHKYFDEADVLIAHNGIKFDNKKSNSKFIEFNLPPPSPYKSIDTLRIARQYFAFTSNKLGDLGQKLGLGNKTETGGFKLWMGCINGDKKSWDLMKKYNKQDVVLLERIYLKLLPWIQNHPIISQTGCQNCTSINLQKRGFSITRKHKYQRYQCGDCGAWSQIRL